MGFMSRFSAAARREEAATMIETYYEVSKRNGMFPGDPGQTARLIVSVACVIAPDLAARRYHPFVLPAACLTVLLMESGEPLEIREHIAMALYGMLQGAKTFPKPYTYAERKYFELAEIVYSQFRIEHPEPVLARPLSSPVAPESSADRSRAMNELISRMKA
jgi:hypothetical protein